MQHTWMSVGPFLVARARVRARVYVAIQVFVLTHSLTHTLASLSGSLIVYLRVFVCVLGSTTIYTRVRSNTFAYIFDSLGFHSHNPWLFASLLLLYTVLNEISHG